MHPMIDFFRTLFLLPLPWRLWVALLMGVNLVAPLFFLPSVEAKVVILTMMVSAGTMMALFAKKGFVRLLGIGHIYWLPLVFWLAARPNPVWDHGSLALWLLAVIVLNSVSLLIDLVDAVRYFMGEKEQTLLLPGRGLR